MNRKAFFHSFCFIVLALSLSGCMPKAQFGAGDAVGISGGDISDVAIAPGTTPRIQGSVSGDVLLVALYSDGSCDTQIGSGDAAKFASPGIQITPNASGTTDIYAQLVLSDGTTEPCSDKLLTYGGSTSSVIGVASLSPSPSKSLSPVLVGAIYGTGITAVNLFSDSDCSTALTLASGSNPISASDFIATAGVTLSVPANKITKIYAQAVGGSDTSCKYLKDYAADTTPPIMGDGIHHALFSPATDSTPPITWDKASNLGDGTDITNIKNYQYAIGHRSDNGAPASDTERQSVKVWTTVGAESYAGLTVSGLTLTANSKYFVSVRAVDQVDQVSDVKTSLGFIAGQAAPIFKINSPVSESSIATSTIIISGDCISGQVINITQSGEVATDSATTSCTSNHFSFTATIKGDPGAKIIGLTQNDGASLVDASVSVNYAPLSTYGLSVSAGEGQSCSTFVGKMLCWGLNASGQVGDASKTDRTSPELLPLGSLTPGATQLVQVSAGFDHTCAVSSDKKAYCWGANASGQLGDGTLSAATAPNPVNMTQIDGGAVKQITAGEYHSCALSDSGQVYCWGKNDAGQVHSDTTAKYSTPTLVSLGEVALQVTAGADFTCALTASLNIKCWGGNTSGTLGQGNLTKNRNILTVRRNSMPDPNETFSYVSAGANQVCAVTSQARIFCWGDNSRGALGTGDTIQYTAPTKPVVGSIQFARVSTGGSAATVADQHTCAVTTGHEIYCWGQNSSGEVGINHTTAATAAGSIKLPTKITTTSAFIFTDVAAGAQHTCARTADDKTFCWGLGAKGRLGLGDTANKSAPNQVNFSLLTSP